MARATLDDLNRMEPGAFAATLGDVFEHSPWIAEAAYAQRPFATLNALYQAMPTSRYRAVVKRSDLNPPKASLSARKKLLLRINLENQTGPACSRSSTDWNFYADRGCDENSGRRDRRIGEPGAWGLWAACSAQWNFPGLAPPCRNYRCRSGK